MRVLFAGSPALGVPSLEAVAQRHRVCGVLTNPDRPGGRGNRPTATPVKLKALELGLPVLQPGKLDPAFMAEVKLLAAEILVVAAFGTIFRREFLELFPRGGINLHPSLLPKYRGMSPIPAVILAGEKETGVTIQRLALKLDSGEILASERVELDGTETTSSLSGRLSRLGAGLLASTLEAIAAGVARGRVQDESEATYCGAVKKEQGRIDWKAPAETIERMIRAFDPWPRVYTHWKGRQLCLHQGSVYPLERSAAGRSEGLVFGVDNRYGILVQTGEGVLAIRRLQLQAKREMDWRAFLNGNRDFVGSALGGMND